MPSRNTMVAVFLLFLSVSVAVALTFMFADVHATQSAQETDTYGMNDRGVIAGDYVDANGVQHGMILTSLTTLVPKLTTADRADCVTSPSSTTIAFYAINNLGVAAGWCTKPDSTVIGFTYAGGKFTDITIPGSTFVEAIGINDAGAIVGTYKDANSVQHGFLLVGSTVTPLDPPGTTSTDTAWSINNAGVITVYGINANGAYVSFTTADQGKTYTPFHDPNEGSIGTAIHQINNNGDIVGTYFDSGNATHGVLYHAGVYNSFDDPNGVGTTRGDGLNNSLVIVGRYGSGVYGGVGYQAIAKP